MRRGHAVAIIAGADTGAREAVAAAAPRWGCIHPLIRRDVPGRPRPGRCSATGGRLALHRGRAAARQLARARHPGGLSLCPTAAVPSTGTRARTRCGRHALTTSSRAAAGARGRYQLSTGPEGRPKVDKAGAKAGGIGGARRRIRRRRSSARARSAKQAALSLRAPTDDASRATHGPTWSFPSASEAGSERPSRTSTAMRSALADTQSRCRAHL